MKKMMVMLGIVVETLFFFKRTPSLKKKKMLKS